MRRLVAILLLLLPWTAVVAQPALASGLQPLGPPPVPPGNPLTPAKAHLGKTLFWEEQLSSTRTVACGTCHAPEAGGADRRWTGGFYYPGFHPGADGAFGTDDDVNGSLGVPASDASGRYIMDAMFGIGAQVTSRQAPSILDAAYSSSLFLDGRADDRFVDPITGAVLLPAGAALENQALGPPLGTSEMAHAGRDWTEVVQRIQTCRPLALSPAIPAALEIWIDCRTYPQLFAEAFGTPDITAARIAMAIASYERTLVADQTPLDLALAGGAPLAPAEARGLAVFASAGCANCHPGSRLTNDEFHAIGLRPPAEDPGRFAVTRDPADLGAFRTPSLRNAELHPPFMHNGQLWSLAEVVEFYDRGGDFPSQSLDPRMIPLGLTSAEKADLIAFLGRPLTDPRLALRQPPFDPPVLYTRSSRVPVMHGPGIPGGSTSQPVMICLEPPLAGSPSFTVAIHGALGGAPAQLVIHDTPPGDVPPPTPSFYTGAINLSGSGVGQGHGSLSLSIPTGPALVGATLDARWYVSDGGLAASETYQLTVFGDPACCSGACGDCDGDGAAGTVLDALAAAQLPIGLLAPAAAQSHCCDVDASGGVTVLDALVLAQTAARLPVPLVCR